MRPRRWPARPEKDSVGSSSTRLEIENASPDEAPVTLPTLVCFPRVVKRPILDRGWITADGLARHLTAMRDAGCVFVDLSRFLETGAADSGPEVVVAFGDEGPEFLELAWPILQQLDVAPVLFVRTAQVGRVRRSLLPGGVVAPNLSWTELRRLASQGVSVQSGGHHGLDAARVPAEMVFGDLIRSRRELENRLGEEAIALQYPFDHGSDVARGLAAQAGFQLGFAAGFEPPFTDRLGLGRLPVGTFSHRGSVLRRLRRPSPVLRGS